MSNSWKSPSARVLSKLFKMEEREAYVAQNYPQLAVNVTPSGLEAIYAACRRVYPDQPNPLQVTALVKYW